MKEFNVLIAGIGGQGVLTLGTIIARAALEAGFCVKASELHGLSLRFGSLEMHVRFGKAIYAPLIPAGEADLVFGLEPLEALRACYFASSRTAFLINTKAVHSMAQYFTGQDYPSFEQIISDLKKFSKRIFVENASEIAKAETGSSVAANIYLLGRAVRLGLLPIQKQLVLKAMSEVIPAKLFESNRALFERAIQS